MCMRQAGTTVSARRHARMIFVLGGGMNVIVSVMLSTAVSNAFSHEKPIRTLMALITARTAVSTSCPVESNPSMTSRTKIRANATAVTKRARTISFIMPCSSMKKWPEMNQSELKKRHQAKPMATTFFICGVIFSILNGMYRMRTNSNATKAMPTPMSSRTWMLSWLLLMAAGSTPSGFGRWPPMANRNACRMTKEAARPTTSSSVSAVSSSHSSSRASSLPSSPSAIL
mmetsp:Transcript_7534/g.17281  ORF Transcript_7534/g.17281 Transcript_7534/m.17281 type:complete len:229 (+) Transcript_7534:533-1219(+)